MPDIDSAFTAALNQPVIYPAWFLFCDVVDDPIRITSSGYNVDFGVEDDPDLSGHSFSAVDPTALDVGTVQHRQAGSETVQISLSGLLGVDQEILDAIADQTKWRGRVVRLWMGVRNEDGEFVGAVVPYYTGYMLALEVNPSAESQTISLSSENYLNLLNAAANRTWLDQNVYDANDTSPAATLGAGNAAKSGPAASVGYVSAGNGGGTFNSVQRMVSSE